MMRKIALTFTVTTLVLGVFGAFFRWLQLMNAFDKETGFPIPGAGVTVVLIVYCVLAAAAICLLTVLWLRRYESDRDAAGALKCFNALPQVLGWALGVAFAAASCVVLFSAGQSPTPLLQRLFGAFGILGGLSIPFLFGKRDSSGAGPMGRTAAVVITLFFCFWMVFDYKSIYADPIVWNYAFEVLAIIASGAALYFVAAFFYGVGKPTQTLIALQLGAFLCITVTFEPRSTALSVLLGISALLQLLLEFLLIANLRET